MSVKTKCVTVVFLLTLMVFIVTECAYCLPEQFKQSIGVITFDFNDIEVTDGQKTWLLSSPSLLQQSCNGFLVKLNSQIYFLTVLHIRLAFEGTKIDINGKTFTVAETKKSDIGKITLPEMKLSFPVDLSKVGDFEGNDIDKIYKKDDDETIDVLCIDVTSSIDKEKRVQILPYDLLATETLSAEIDRRKDIFVCGYPGNNIIEDYNKLQRYYQEPLFKISPVTNFGKLIYIKNDEKKVSGYFYNAKLQEGDCGRPSVINIGSKFFIIGLHKTGGCGAIYNSAAVDSTGMIRTIKALIGHQAKLKN